MNSFLIKIRAGLVTLTKEIPFPRVLTFYTAWLPVDAIFLSITFAPARMNISNAGMSPLKAFIRN